MPPRPPPLLLLPHLISSVLLQAGLRAALEAHDGAARRLQPAAASLAGGVAALAAEEAGLREGVVEYLRALSPEARSSTATLFFAAPFPVGGCFQIKEGVFDRTRGTALLGGLGCRVRGRCRARRRRGGLVNHPHFAMSFSAFHGMLLICSRLIANCGCVFPARRRWQGWWRRRWRRRR